MPFILRSERITKSSQRGLLIAIGVNEDGYREIIGFQVANTESKFSWGELFSSLKERGLEDVHLITSDDHKGLVIAARRHFQGGLAGSGVKHIFSRNMLDHTPQSIAARNQRRPSSVV